MHYIRLFNSVSDNEEHIADTKWAFFCVIILFVGLITISLFSWLFLYRL